MSTAGICRFVSSIVSNNRLTTVSFQFSASECAGARFSWWSDAKLATPSDEVARQGWTALLHFLRLPTKVRFFCARLYASRVFLKAQRRK
jgi:hypothetical protein